MSRDIGKKPKQAARKHGDKEAAVQPKQLSGGNPQIAKGDGEAPVQDYEFMQRRLELLEGLSRVERAVLEGRVCNQSEAREKMSKWLR
ncbi:MAG TPA: hypothetical protein IAA18_08580 [Candidatus Pseudomonas excrementavium]|uniref:hypothetical protein n=1 Tax=Halopseudomonas bauzanensis TaxID=653930 RepID=UPI001C3A219D|nr:hypothetical protein [Halopseudomonas bauzanensis]HIZ51125.1 hypothetical protein [Candidatus Pseudomonas excrementavium]